MMYFVYRQKANRQFEEVAHTKYAPDAQLVFDNWHAAYIACGGEILAEKNLVGEIEDML